MKTSFQDAAKRHFRDAQWLDAEKASTNADHLSGLAAECALKALIVHALGGKMSGSYAISPETDRKLIAHVGDGALWTEVSMLASKRGNSSIVGLTQGDNPFKDWDVAERYSDGQHLTSQVIKAHLEAARKIIMTLENTMFTGTGA